METIAGNTSNVGTFMNAGHADGAGSEASFYYPSGVALVATGAVAFVVRLLMMKMLWLLLLASIETARNALLHLPEKCRLTLVVTCCAASSWTRRPLPLRALLSPLLPPTHLPLHLAAHRARLRLRV